MTAVSRLSSVYGWPSSSRLALANWPRFGGSSTLPADGNVADEPAVRGDELDDHAVVVRLGVHLNIGVAAGGEQPLDAGAHHGHAQRLVALQRQNLEEFGALQGLLPRDRTGC